jgi:hypothetical protein
MVCTFIGTLCKYATCIMRSLKRSSRCYWSAVDCDGRATCIWNWLTALLLERLLGVLLFTEARSMKRAVQWNPMNSESWSGWFPLKSSPTCSCCWLHCDLQNVSRKLLELYVLTGQRHLRYWLTELNWTRSRSRSRSYFTTDGQSWYRVSLWDLRPDIISCRNVAVWNLLSCIYWAPSLTRGRVCNLQCNHSIVRVAQNPKPYFTFSSETPPTWKARFPIYIPQEQGGPVIPPGTGFPLGRLLRLAGLRWMYSNPPPTWRDRSVYI